MDTTRRMGLETAIPFPILSAYILKLLRRFGALPDLEDIAQEVMIKLVKNQRSLPKHPAKLYCWVRTTTHNLAVDFLRDAQKESAVIDRTCELDTNWDTRDGDEEHFKFQAVAPENSVEPDVKDILRRAISQLTPPHRQVLLLDAAGYGYDEIAELLSLNIGTVRSRLYYARQNARELIQV